MTTEIILKNLPKVSANTFYQSTPWRLRTEIQRNFKSLVQSQCDNAFSKDNKYDVEYVFTFKSYPLDATNCFIMLKWIEDVFFKNDEYHIVKSITVKSRKGKEDSVKIIVNRH